MLQRKSSNLFSALISLAMVSLMVTTGCTLRPRHEGGTGAIQQSSLSTPVNPPNPGPYKTIVVDGVEMKQGRFPQGKYGGTLVQDFIATDAKSFNPWTATDSQSLQFAALMFSSLAVLDSYTGDVAPDLAASIETRPDHLTYLVHLRKGLTWSDGKPLNAQDVEFTFNTIVAKEYGNSSLRDGLTIDGQFPSITVVDPLTVEFKTPKPFAPFLRALSGIAIAPKHIIEPILASKDGRKRFEQLWTPTDSTMQKTLVTSGPFTLSAYKPSERIEFSRTKNFYMVDPSGKTRLPYLDKLEYLIIPDVNTHLLRFEGGETDVAAVRAKDAAKILAEASKLNITLYNLGPMTSSTFIMFNENRRKNDKGKPYVTPYKSAWFNDVNFRQAVNHALNRQQMIDGYLKGIGAPSYGSEPGISPFFDKQLKPIEQDLNYSKQLLAQSGFKTGADGKLHDKDGHAVEFDLLAPAGGTFYDAIGGYITNDLAKLGMKVNYAPIDGNVLEDKVDSAKDWEAAIYGFAGDPLDPSAGMNVWKSNGRMHLFDLRNKDQDGRIVVTDARPWENELDKLCNEGVEELDVAKRKQIYDRYQQIVYEQAPFIYLITPMQIVGAKNTLRNYQPTQLSQVTYGVHNPEEMWKEGAGK